MSDVTNEQIQAWADEAERGYDVDELRSRMGRPRLDLSGPAQVVPVRLTPAQLAKLDERDRQPDFLAHRLVPPPPRP